MTNLETLACVSRVVLMNDERAFEKIVRAYSDKVRRFFMSQTTGNEDVADDLTQETFIRVWQKLDSFKRLASFSTWLYEVAYHIWLDHLRRIGRKAEVCSFDDAIDVAEVTMQQNASESLAERERQEWVHDCLLKMSEPSRTCLTLFYINELSVREISRITELSEVNVRAILSRGRKQLKQILISNKS